MIKIYHKSIKEQALQEIPDVRLGSWVHASNPTEDDLIKLSETLHLELGHLKDALDPHEVPRLEIENEALYIFSRFPLSKEGQIMTAPLLIVMGEESFVTITNETIPSFDRFIEKTDINTTQKTKLLIQIFSHVISLYNNFVASIGKQVRSTSINIEQITNRDIIQLVNFETVLNDFLGSLVPTSAILKNLLSGKHLKLFEEDKDLIEDLGLSSEQLMELSRSNLKNIVNIREAYSTIVTNNLNRVIKMLTSLTIVLTVPMIISSLYGMNVHLPYAASPFAFWGILGLTSAVSASILTVLIKNRWL